MPQDQQGALSPALGQPAGTLAAAPVLDRQCLDNNGPLTMRRLGLAIVAALISTAPALAQPNCRNTADFGRWLADFKR